MFRFSDDTRIDEAQTKKLAELTGLPLERVYAFTNEGHVSPFESEHYEKTSAGVLLAADERWLDGIKDASPGSLSTDLCWIEDTYAAAAQRRAYARMTEHARDKVVQLGGRGIMACSVLRCYPEASVALASPIFQELIYCAQLARRMGVEDQIVLVQTEAECWPFAPESLDLIVSNGSVHHIDLLKSGELLRSSLRPGGLFLSWDIYGSPLYRAGVRLFGKFENVQCRPLNEALIRMFADRFSTIRIWYEGGYFRYGFGLIRRLGWQPPGSAMWLISAIDARLTMLTGARRSTASLVYLELVR